MRITARIKAIVREAGFPYTSKTLEGLKKEHAADRLSCEFADQWTMRLSEALNMHRLTRDELKELAS